MANRERETINPMRHREYSGFLYMNEIERDSPIATLSPIIMVQWKIVFFIWKVRVNTIGGIHLWLIMGGSVSCPKKNLGSSKLRWNHGRIVIPLSPQGRDRWSMCCLSGGKKTQQSWVRRKVFWNPISYPRNLQQDPLYGPPNLSI